MSKYLFLFTISPVQSFISQARKTQDLYAGSYILSHLCKEAISTAYSLFPDPHQKTVEIIFPHFEQKSPTSESGESTSSNPKSTSLPNRFVALIEIKEELDENKINKELKEIGDTVEREVREEFKRIFDTIIKELSKEFHISKPPGSEEQIKNHLIINWAFHPLDKDKDESTAYQKAYQEIEKIIGSIKNVRNFKQLNEPAGRKCAITGEHNALFYKATKSYDGKESIPAFIENNACKVSYNFPYRFLAQGEAIGAVSFLKRCAEKYFTLPDAPQSFNPPFISGFPSTGEIAMMKWLKQISKDEQDEYKNLFKENFDPVLYYKENVENTPENINRLKKNGQFKNEELLEKAREMLDGFYKQYGEPPKYYAILRFDGDSMGEWLSGDNLKADASLLKFHERLSEKLGIFSSYCSSYFENKTDSNASRHDGRTVYAGGDDYLGLINLEDLLDVMEHFRKRFDEKLFEGENSLSNFIDSKITFSAGVAIAHYKIPLSEVLQWSKKMEEKAKKISGKDAFAIAVLKHSGEIHETAFKWKYSDQWTTDILKKIIDKISKDEYSNTFIKQLNVEMNKIMDKEGKIIELNDKPERKKIIETELKCLINRSCMRKKEESGEEFKERKREDSEKLVKNIKYLFWKCDYDMNNLLSFLNIADFMARHTERKGK